VEVKRSAAQVTQTRLKRQAYIESGGTIALSFLLRIVVWVVEEPENGPVGTGGSLWLYLLPLVVIAVAFVWLRVADLEVGDKRGIVFLAILTVCAIALGVVRFDFSAVIILLLGPFEAFWFFRRRRQALLAIAVMAAMVSGAMVLVHGRDAEQLNNGLLNLAVNVGLGTVIGLWWTSDQKHSLANARLVDQLQAAQVEIAASQRAAGVAAERERVAREIHDTLAQGFTTVLMQTQAADRALARGDLDTVRQRHDIVRDVARDNLAEARALVTAFAPAPLQGASLADALRRLARRWSAETGVPVDLRLTDVGSLSADAEVVLLRAAQEALTNVARHAEATEVSLRLGGRQGLAARLVVQDNGQGMAGATEGYGLAGMRSRVAEIGGTLTVTPAPEGGTVIRVTLSLPLNDSAPKEES